jgi:hypothetical protein
MARKSQHGFSKRQRERKKAEKAERKRARKAAPRDPEAPHPETERDDAPAGEDDRAAST